MVVLGLFGVYKQLFFPGSVVGGWSYKLSGTQNNFLGQS